MKSGRRIYLMTFAASGHVFMVTGGVENKGPDSGERFLWMGVDSKDYPIAGANIDAWIEEVDARESRSWQEIETAPKNPIGKNHGPQILGIDDAGHQEVCWWENYNGLTEWVTTGGLSFYPVKWMPLQKPREAKQDGR